MTNEEKDILLKDLCARLRYGIFLNIGNYSDYILQGIVNSDINKPLIVSCEGSNFNCSIEIVKPYLRPMSSMTEDEKNEYRMFIEYSYNDYTSTSTPCVYVDEINEYVIWLISHHFDYKGLIERGLALEAPEGMYKI